MTWSLPRPMLAVAVDSPALPAGYAAEPKLWTGFVRVGCPRISDVVESLYRGGCCQAVSAVNCRNGHEEVGGAGDGGGEADLGVAAELLSCLLQSAGGDGDPQERLGANAQPGKVNFGGEPEDLAADQRFQPTACGEGGGVGARCEAGVGGGLEGWRRCRGRACRTATRRAA
ncbi:hypothetical protein GCM10023097_61990 [Streptomyces collinus]